MKKLITLFLVLSLSACKTLSVVDFVKHDAPHDTKILIIDKKIKPAVVIKYLQGLKLSPLDKRTRSNVLALSEVEGLVSRYQNDTITKYWNKTELPKQFSIISDPELQILEANDIRSNNFFYYISDPLIVNQNTEIFYASKARRSGMIYFSKVIVSKKVNNRWIVVEEIEGPELY